MTALTQSVIAGARDGTIEGVEVTVVEALAFARGEADHRDILEADGYLLGTVANFGYMSGALKHVFDSTFQQIGGALDASGAASPTAGATRGRPVGLYVHGNYDTTGAVRSVNAITGALGWKPGYPSVEVIGVTSDTHLESCYTLGATISALLTD